jgi:putative ABC transport system ATP-binding protein
VGNGYPLLVLADELTANLDTANGQQAMEIMQQLNRETRTVFVFATHDPRVVSFARRAINMQDGRLVSDRERNLIKFVRA